MQVNIPFQPHGSFSWVDQWKKTLRSLDQLTHKASGPPGAPMISGYQGGFSSSYDQPVSRAAVQNLDPVGSGWGGVFVVWKAVSSNSQLQFKGDKLTKRRHVCFIKLLINTFVAYVFLCTFSTQNFGFSRKPLIISVFLREILRQTKQNYTTWSKSRLTTHPC